MIETTDTSLLTELEAGTTLVYPCGMYPQVAAEVGTLFASKQFLTVRVMPDFTVQVFKRGRKPRSTT